ncbi:PepSY domain-containing protein [Eubacterium aggregans]|uniref:PepSY domain-containing protein n=1 Tax=Eubacterium aggregans TaxID=81409 RepID=UPI003F33B082
MKRNDAFAVLLIGGMLILSGCGGKMATNSTPTVSTTPTVTTQATPTGNDNATDITAEKAKEMALTKAGVKESDTYELKVETGTENGRRAYEVDFKAGGHEYEYDIDYSTGEIIQSQVNVD